MDSIEQKLETLELDRQVGIAEHGLEWLKKQEKSHPLRTPERMIERKVDLLIALVRRLEAKVDSLTNASP